ncbi:MAG: response regulator [Bacteroidales bacterium]|nr:response regulator [Bacteroidales bacterium]
MRSNLDFSKFRILIVDDVPLNRVLVEKMLGNFNFNVHQCENGLECMKEFYYQKPDLVLLDILMPLMNGFEVIEAVRENPAWKDVKIVVLSALNSNEDIVKAFNLGADDFITKPIVMDKLLNTVAKHLGLPLTDVSK